ncbi:MAG: hypothetical protein II803_03000, partial [Firmicutes bacterium]|nr:hypothetical protein [Bacillota bacterium]
NPQNGDLNLYREIARKTSNSIRKKSGTTVKGRENKSFASKFCHFACLYLFDDEKQDNYSIYDSILKKVLPMYLDYYGIKEKYNLDEYGEYCQAIDMVRMKAAAKTRKTISRNGFDQLLWFYHKGRMYLYE